MKNDNAVPIEDVSEDRLTWLLSNQDILDDIPPDLDKELMNMFKVN